MTQPPGFLMHAGVVMNCAHPPGAAALFPAPTQQRVLIGGVLPVAVLTDFFQVTGCALTPAGTPCTSIKWIRTATRVTVNGVPALLQTLPPPGVGDGAGVGSPPPNPPMVKQMQTRVLGA